MNDKIKEVLRQAVLIVEYRSGDVDTADGCFAATCLDTMINLEAALCDAFETIGDDATFREIAPKIDTL